MAKKGSNVRQEFIKIAKNSVAWIYIHSKNGFTSVAPHWHRDTEITFLLCGSAEYVLNGTHSVLHPGDLILINDGVVHSCDMNTAEFSDAVSIIFPYEFITQFQKGAGSVYFSLDPQLPAYEELKELFRQLYHTMLKKTEDPFCLLDLNRLVYEIASLLFHHFISNNQPLVRISSDRYKMRCEDIAAFIDDHYAENLTLDSLARRFSISREHLSRTFKDYMGTTFKKYLTLIRMHHAYQELINTDLTLLDISMSNGFSDYRTFIRCFKEIYGITPLKYRKIKETSRNISDNEASLNVSKHLSVNKLQNESQQ